MLPAVPISAHYRLHSRTRGRCHAVPEDTEKYAVGDRGTLLPTRTGFRFHVRPAMRSDSKTLAEFFKHVTCDDHVPWRDEIATATLVRNAAFHDGELASAIRASNEAFIR